MTRPWPVLISAVTAMPGASGTCRPATVMVVASRVQQEARRSEAPTGKKEPGEEERSSDREERTRRGGAKLRPGMRVISPHLVDYAKIFDILRIRRHLNTLAVDQTVTGTRKGLNLDFGILWVPYKHNIFV